MSSVRRLKQKRRATSGTIIGMNPGQLLEVYGPVPTDYDYRKAAFAALPPATTVRPMRIVKQRVQAALEAMQRGLAFASKAGMSFDQARAVTTPQRERVESAVGIYKKARRAADAGNGPAVHAAAA